MQRQITRGAAAGAGLIFHVFAQDSASTTGAGKASVAFGSWSCRYIRNGEAISGAITPEDITTIGTYAAPTANTNIRIKAVDNTNMIGIYEIQIHADWVNTTNSCQSLTIYLTATGVAVLPLQIPLAAFNLQDAVRGGLTALPNANADAAGGLIISDAGGLDADAQRADVAAILVDTGTTLQGELDGIQADTEDIQTRLPAALVGGRMDSSVGAMANNVLTAAAINANAINAAKLDPDVTTELQNGLATAAALATVDGIVDDILLDTAEIGAAGAGLTNINLPDQTMNITGNITGNLSGSVGSVTGNVGGNVAGSVGSVTAEVTPTAASKTGYRLSATGVGDIKTTAMTESYAADGAAPTMEQALFGILQFLTERAISTTTLTVNKLDGTTAAMTFTLDDASSPTSITRAT